MLDLDALLAPLPGPTPCGEDLLFSSEFDAIQAARQHDDPSLEQGDWVIDLKEADWRFVVAESSRLLRTATKDLRLAAWLAEALGVEHGFEGLTDGYRLLAGLCERYWDAVHPLPEDGDMDMRNGNIAWLVTRTVELLQRTPIVDDGTRRHGLLAWQTAVALDHAIKRNPSDADDLRQGKLTLEQFDQARRATPGKFFAATHAQLQTCRAAILRFEQVFDERTASAGPSFGPVKEALDALMHATERFASDAGVALSTAAAPAATGNEAASPAATSAPQRVEPTFHDPAVQASTAAPSPARPEGIHSRASAIAQLSAVADYFERTEPSSPAAYMARKAARWADMPLHAWLRNVIKNEQELSQLEDLLDVLDKAQRDNG
ncbi:MAG: type VI secretion system protein TssA [Proteobacteria bacterium]|nr:type VI secretion system protein TssA [Pseudomonadota bacterium]